MDCRTNKTPDEVLKERAFGGTYFYSSVNQKWHKKSWKEFDQLKNIDQSIIAQVFMLLVLINMVLNVKHL